MADESIPTVQLRDDGIHIEAICPKCEEVIGKFPNQRAAYLNAGRLREHVESCDEKHG